MDEEEWKSLASLIGSIERLAEIRPLTSAEREVFQEAICRRDELEEKIKRKREGAA